MDHLPFWIRGDPRALMQLLLEGEFTLHGTRVTRVEEKPRKEFPVNAGIYLLDPAVIALIPDGQYFDATDMIRVLLDAGRPVAAHLIREYWLDVGRLHDLEKANRDVAEGLLDDR